MTVEESEGTEKKGPAMKKVAPDGGWAWMVCFGVSLVNFSTRSLEPSFGLLFKDLLDDLGVRTTGASVIASTLDSVINFTGFFVGPAIKTFSYRKVCFVGSIICAIRLLLTAPANSMGHILATYSIFGGIGVGLASSSAFVSLNHYFSKKRGQAVGLSMAGAGIGLMVMPQLVKILLREFGFRWSVVILGGIAFHALLGSCLLQPIKRHLKEEPVDCEIQLVKEKEYINESQEEGEDKFEMNPLVSHPMPELLKQRSQTNMNHPSVRTIGLPRAKTCDKPLQEFDNINTSSLTTAASVATMQRVTSSGSMNEAVRKRKMSLISNISNMDFTGSFLQLYTDTVEEDTLQMKSIKNVEPEEKKLGFIKKFISLMDLDLLKDWSFLNLLLGLSLFWSGELQFRMLTPFFIRSLGYDMNDTAFCLSMAAITDICVRLILPPIFDRTNITRKKIFFISAFFLAATRSVLAQQSEWVPLITWLLICGFFRGMCLTNFTLTISEYCTLEKLPAAFGLHMVSKGVMVVIIGPLIGIGVGLASSSAFVSLNHYFSKKRGQAVGLSMAGAGIGLMVMPQLVKILLREFGFRWSVVILGGIAFHALLGSCLLQPIKRHLKEEPVDCEIQLVKEKEYINESQEEGEDKFEMNPLVSHPMPELLKQRSQTNMNHPSVRTIGLPRAKTCDKPLQEFDNINTSSLTTAASVATMQRVTSSGSMSEAVRKRKMSLISNISNMDFTGSFLQLYTDTVEEDTLQMKSIKNVEPEEKKLGFIKKFISLMDLDLLKDWSFLNLLLGLSLFWSGELQFRMLTPFFIRSLGYDMNDTAFCLSMAAITDICVRLILPPIFDRTNITRKKIFFISAFFLAATRSVLAQQSEWVPLITWLLICGFFRGMCLTNFTLTISEYCTLEKLPAAFGLHMVSKGVMVVIIGPLIGYVRDYTGSFSMCIHVQNALIMTCVLVWGVEYAYAFTRRRKVLQI